MLRTTVLGSVSLVCLYRGKYTVTEWPRAARAWGSAPTTSASPPVFEKGTHSDAANTMCIGNDLQKVSARRSNGAGNPGPQALGGGRSDSSAVYMGCGKSVNVEKEDTASAADLNG